MFIPRDELRDVRENRREAGPEPVRPYRESRSNFSAGRCFRGSEVEFEVEVVPVMSAGLDVEKELVELPVREWPEPDSLYCLPPPG